ncbi:MAG: thioesterase family protein [Crocinitomicaceae bacterium]|nr:acyl-CoA thioesterase [Crocinitomicaceae bacterium]MDG1349851.1 thioesterase family protein [Crocinitomicaceae bacterium]MDG1735109.1 thioesterase family protein [Crocinitomicaceae bacterium]MDG2505716.1 thioesterase family protein [Crocinitomicaceae bacterium]
MERKTKHLTEIRVRYGETDRMGFCYYGNYAQFLEVARVELLRSQGISYKELEDAGILLPVRNFSIKYIAPSRYDDLLSIQTEITNIKGSRIEFNYEIRNQNNVLIATAYTELVFVNSNSLKPTNAPDEILTFYENDIK